MVEQILANANKLNVNLDSIIVENNDKIEEVVINNIDLHELRSCSKILIAFAYGIAIENKMKCKNGEVLSLNTKIAPTFSKLVKDLPEYVNEWTIRTLLTHSTGYEKMMFNEAHVEKLDKYKLLDELFKTEKKFASNTHFTYSNVEPYLLSVFFQENFGENIKDFIDKTIFKPLEINNFIWNNFGNYCAGATGLFINYKDFHKIAKLLMNYGKYNNKQIVPEKWVKEMTKPQSDCKDYYKPERVLPKLNAGYFTWISRDNIIFRDGSEGQYIICDYKNNRLITIMATEKNMSQVIECLRTLI